MINRHQGLHNVRITVSCKLASGTRCAIYKFGKPRYADMDHADKKIRQDCVWNSFWRVLKIVGLCFALTGRSCIVLSFCRRCLQLHLFCHYRAIFRNPLYLKLYT